MVVERNDFSIATYSVVSSIGFAAAVTSVTVVGGICGGGPAVCVRLQAAAARPAHITAHPVLVNDTTPYLIRPLTRPGRSAAAMRSRAPRCEVRSSAPPHR